MQAAPLLVFMVMRGLKALTAPRRGRQVQANAPRLISNGQQAVDFDKQRNLMMLQCSSW